MRINACLTETIVGKRSVGQLLEMQENNQMQFPVHAIVDAKSVFDSAMNVRAVKVADAQLTLHVFNLSDFLRLGRVQRIWWIDTRDMVSDDRTKGVVDRVAINDLTKKCEWKVEFAVISFTRV